MINQMERKYHLIQNYVIRMSNILLKSRKASSQMLAKDFSLNAESIDVQSLLYLIGVEPRGLAYKNKTLIFIFLNLKEKCKDID